MTILVTVTIVSAVITPLSAIATLVMVVLNARQIDHYNKRSALWTDKIALMSARAVTNHNPTPAQLATANELIERLDKKYERDNA